MACLSLPTVVSLVDDAGAPVAARGERRTNRESQLGVALPFDCGLTADAGVAPCRNGFLFYPEDHLAPGIDFEVRFALADGSFTAWQPVPLELERHNDPDFNGPGCPCSWYNAAPTSVIVPAEARPPSDG